MYQPRKLRLTASILLCLLLQAQGADKYTDENRPYEFGFKIDGQQHRHESKDKDGIIMGEFGFITADDVYHITVYATDKEGRFKILSMKNIHLKSTPESPTSARQGHSLPLPPAQPAFVQAVAPPQATSAPQPAKPFKAISIEPPGRSCSSCSIPTSTRVPPPTFNQAPPNQLSAPGLQNKQSFPPGRTGQQNSAQGVLDSSSYSPQVPQNYPTNQQNYPQQGPGSPAAPNFVQQPGQSSQTYPGSSAAQNFVQQPGQSPQTYSGSPAAQDFAQPPGQLPQTYPSSPATQGFALQPGQSSEIYPGSPAAQDFAQQPGQSPQNYPGANSPNNFGQGGAGQQPDVSEAYPGVSTGGSSGPNGPGGFEKGPYLQGAPAGRTSKQYNGPSNQFSSNKGPNGLLGPGSAPSGQRASAKPMLFTAQMQIVDQNTDIHALRPGEKEGLPPGLTKDDMTQLLYTFNYTVGFHGHFEEGYTNGVKKGYYYVTGRNGVRTRIDYVADDTGFHPTVSQDILDLLSDDVPKPETEKDAKFGLKGYEFKWLYYPVDSKRR